MKSFNGTDYDTVIGNRKFLYDDWNLIAEFDALSTLTLVRSYTWGLDLAGTLDQTGGVGALLQMHDHAATKTYLPTYDGNGNVVSLIDAENTTMTIAALYEYGPYGESVRTEVSDSTVADFPFRFSTKFTDGETGLVYYGHRYYSPSLGRFITRDPIAEEGGLNLFGFVGNDPVNRVDYLGLDDIVKLPTYEVTTTPWTKLNDLFLDWYARNRNSGMGSININFDYMQFFGSISRADTAVTESKPPIMAPTKPWKPTKTGCDALRSQYPELFKDSLDEFASPLQAFLAATIDAGAFSASAGAEAINLVFQRDNGSYGYVFSNASDPRDPTSAYINYRALPQGSTLLAVTHGHNIGAINYAAGAQARNHNVDLAQAMNSYARLGELFSYSDMNVPFRGPRPTTAGVFTPSGDIRAYSNKVYGPPSKGDMAPGYRVPGAPSKVDALKIVACKSSRL